MVQKSNVPEHVGQHGPLDCSFVRFLNGFPGKWIMISGCYQIRKPGSAFHDSIVAPLNERIPCALKANCKHQWWDKSAPYHMPHMSNYLFATSNCPFFNRAQCQTPVLRFCWAYGQYLVGPSVHSALCGISALLHHSWRRNVFACKVWFKQLWCTWQWKEQAMKASRKGHPLHIWGKGISTRSHSHKEDMHFGFMGFGNPWYFGVVKRNSKMLLTCAWAQAMRAICSELRAGCCKKRGV